MSSRSRSPRRSNSSVGFRENPQASIRHNIANWKEWLQILALERHIWLRVVEGTEPAIVIHPREIVAKLDDIDSLVVVLDRLVRVASGSVIHADDSDVFERFKEIECKWDRVKSFAQGFRQRSLFLSESTAEWRRFRVMVTELSRVLTDRSRGIFGRFLYMLGRFFGLMSRERDQETSDLSRTPEMKIIQTLNHSCVWENDFFEIPLDLATAAFDVKDKIVLHRRPAVKELYQRLNTRGLALVKGSPGSGKSTCMFAMALGLAGQCEESAILWVKIDALEFMVIKRSGIDHFSLPSDSWDPLISIMNSGSMSFSGIFVDQCRLNHQKTSDDAKLLRIFFNNWKKKDGCRRLYAITSDGCNDYRGTGFKRKDVIELKSWTLEEYLVVLKN
jgi:hypothetical protein